MDDAKPAATEPAPKKNGRLRPLLLWGLPFLVVVVAVYLYGSAGRHVSTDDAYLQQDRVDVTSEVSANVVAVLTTENAHVAAGETVLQLDDSQYRIAVAGDEARLATARAEIASLKAAYREKLGEIEVARRAAALTMRDFERQKELAARKLVSASAIDTASRTVEISNGSVAVLQLQLAQSLTKLDGNANLPVDSYPAVRAALAQLESARLDLAHTTIKAPQAGIASHLPKVGGRIDIGRAAFAIVTDNSLWAEANFKETDLEWVRPGQPVVIDVDTYSRHRWTGHVESIAQATGAEFSLLPPQNASGNWVKVVQRIPVRIALDRKADDPPLRDGMSVSISIDTGPHTRFDRWFGRRH